MKETILTAWDKLIKAAIAALKELWEKCLKSLWKNVSAFVAAAKLRDFRSRFKPWTTRGKSCKRCCLRCKYFGYCSPDFNNDKE